MPVLCLCSSQLPYQICCQPLHLGQAYALTAEQLMRSRYVAYVTQNIEYIVETTVPAQQAMLDQQAMLQWSKQTQWDGLEILKHIAKINKHHAQVEFKAYFKKSHQRDYHHELSTFVCIDTRWYFIDPTVPHQLTMKQPCFCGSGKKYKQCCAVYL